VSLVGMGTDWGVFAWPKALLPALELPARPVTSLKLKRQIRHGTPGYHQSPIKIVMMGLMGLVPHGGNSVTLQELEMPVQQGFAFCIPRSGTSTVRRKFAHP